MHIAVAGCSTQQDDRIDQADRQQRDDVAALEIFWRAAEIRDDDEPDEPEAEHAGEQLHDPEPSHRVTLPPCRYRLARGNFCSGGANDRSSSSRSRRVSRRSAAAAFSRTCAALAAFGIATIPGSRRTHARATCAAVALCRS